MREETELSGSWWPEIRSGELVAYLTDEEQARLFAAMETAEVEEGNLILHKGSPSRSLLMVEEGELEVVDDALGDAVIVDRIGPGGVVGEVGFLDGRPRTHDVRAGADCRLRRITREKLLDLVKDDPTLFAKLTIALAELMATRFRAAVAEMEPVRAFAAALREPEDLEVDMASEVAEGYQMADEPLSEQALELMREVGRKHPKGVVGV
jgi:CRP/FNR family cyclic AMP-dependent transcriptional regulator